MELGEVQYWWGFIIRPAYVASLPVLLHSSRTWHMSTGMQPAGHVTIPKLNGKLIYLNTDEGSHILLIYQANNLELIDQRNHPRTRGNRLNSLSILASSQPLMYWRICA